MNKCLLLLIIAVLAVALTPKAQTGGSYDLSHNVIGSGGGTSSNGTFRLEGTIGQGIAGTASTGGSFSVHGGFWVPGPLFPTAAPVSVSGRVLSASGRGISGVLVSLTSIESGWSTVRTNSLGYFRFNNVVSGQTYILSVSSPRYTFDEPTRLINITDNIADADFIAQR